MNPINLFTIGFTQTTAEEFFTSLKNADIKRIVDVRLNNTSQLSGFAKQKDLVFFLKEIVGIDYIHIPELAPTKEILDAFKKHKGDWSVYEHEFFNLMENRRIDESIAKEVFDQGCMLCSEKTPHHCHRRLVAEYLEIKWGDVSITHLGCK